MNKVKIFDKEISYVKDKSHIVDISYLIDSLPDYFFEVPASSTGKYHPSYALGEGGLVRHTKAAVKLAYELLNNPIIGSKYTDNEKDLIYMALMLHDGVKSGLEKSQYTKFDHPLLACEFIKSNKKNLSLEDDEIEFMCDIISSHMGPWNKDFDGIEVLPVPKNKYQNFVHMCDYLASRKAINFNFDKDNNIID